LARTRKPDLTDAERKAIRQMRAENPKLTYREIGARFKVTPACICGVLNNRFVSDIVPVKAVMQLPPAPSPYTSFTPDPIAMRGGRAHPLRRLSAAR